ncbi:cytochrome-c peroxidase [Undibacterium parvum]|nr:cytochrome c peroxidase [Undibacterium parvum]
MKKSIWLQAWSFCMTFMMVGYCVASSDLLTFDMDISSWSSSEMRVLQSLHIDQLPPAPVDRSNAYERIPATADLGKRLFFDARFSANQKISCASCHSPQQQFQDGLALGQGIGKGKRRTMSIVESGRSPWQFWDGRKDSLWAQALGPMEDANEHGGNRLAFANLIRQHYQSDYEKLFGSMPDLKDLPGNASPNGTAEERDTWAKLSEASRQSVSGIFANMGKAIAAYERTLHHAPSRLDNYIAGTLHRDPTAGQILSSSEKRGLRLFIGKGECISCHGGALMTDQHFHNTGVVSRDVKNPDQGRSSAISTVVNDQFNCLGKFSDAGPRDCQELEFIANDDPHMVGAFKTPSLRNVALRPPYMHAGQISTLRDVIHHYADAPSALVGHNERKRIAFSEQEIDDLVSFLGTLSSAGIEN